MGTKWDRRIDEIEKRIGEAGKLPPSARGPFFAWADEEGVKHFSDIEQQLKERFKTTEGAEFVSIGWQEPKPKTDIFGDIQESA